MSFKNVGRLIFWNLLVLLALLALAELAMRVSRTLQSCGTSSGCESVWLSNLKVNSLEALSSKGVGMTRVHDLLGYVPAPGFDAVLEGHGWSAGHVRIDQDGFRDNQNGFVGRRPILVVGDSFAFGDQVSNQETWPSCLERLSGIGVSNAGVFGFGAAQSVLRAKIELEKRPFETVILSVLVEGDFGRDQLSYRGGFSRPAVIKVDGRLDWAPPPDPLAPGSIRNPVYGDGSFANRTAQMLYERSLLVSALNDKVFGGYLGVGRLTKRHPDAASLEEIIHFTFREFAQLPATNKMVLFQYSQHLESKYDTAKKRRLARDAADRLGLRVVDTFDRLRREDPEKVWNEHHTPYGNQLVCEGVLEALGAIVR